MKVVYKYILEPARSQTIKVSGIKPKILSVKTQKDDIMMYNFAVKEVD